MIYLELLLSISALSSFTILLVRIELTGYEIKRIRNLKCELTNLLSRIFGDLYNCFDHELLPDAGPCGLADIPVWYTELDDRYEVVSSLVDAIADALRGGSVRELVEVPKRLYQLQYTSTVSRP